MMYQVTEIMMKRRTEVARLVSNARPLDNVPRDLESTLVVIDRPPDPFVCVLWLKRTRSQWHCVSLRVAHRDPLGRINGELLKSVKVAEYRRIAEKAIDDEGSAFEEIVWDPERVVRVLGESIEAPLEELDSLVELSSPKPSIGLPGAHSDKHYELVADLYMQAVDRGLPLNSLILDSFPVAESTAQGYIAEARKRGLIPPKPPPKATSRRTRPRDGTLEEITVVQDEGD